MPDVTAYIRIAGIVIVLLLFPLGYLKGCSDEKEDFDAYKATVAAAGKAQEERTKVRIAEDKKAKEKADAEHDKVLAALNARIASLRARRTDSGFMPPATPGTASPDVATFNRSELERALRTLDSEVQGIADEGSKAVIDLDAAKAWAQGR